MGGRRTIRNSTGDEAEDQSETTRYMNEEDILQPVSKDLHPDNWPIFVLNGAVVYNRDGRTPANLLEAELNGPLIVRGKLEVDKDFRHLQKVTISKASKIEVPDVKGFSMGIGPVTIWANGKTGWFEIRPAHSYRKLYVKMAEGITLYYVLTEIYESRKSTNSFYIDQIFDQYISRQKDKSLTRGDVAQRCEDHAIFLFSQMRKPGESIRWPRTSFYRWLIERCPEIYKRYDEKSDADEASAILPRAVRGRKVQSKSNFSSILPSKENEICRSVAATAYRTMMDLHLTGIIPRRRLTVEQLSKVLYERYDLVSQILANEVIKIHASSLCKSLGNEWAATPIYSTLEAYANQQGHKVSSLGKVAKSVILKPRIGAKRTSSSDTVHESSTSNESLRAPRRRLKRSFEDDEEEDSPSHEEYLNEQLGVNRRKSVDTGQQLTKNEPKGQSKPSRTKARKSLEETNTNIFTKPRRSDEEDRCSTASSGRALRRRTSRSGKIAALRPPLTPATGGDGLDGRSNKRPKFSHVETNEDIEDESDENPSPYLEAGVSEDESTITKEELTMVSEPLPLTSPQGPNGLWTCDKENCSFRVSTADKSEGQAKVRAHFLDHADEIEKRENLVLEETRPYLQTSHLLEKLRSLGEKARLAEEKNIRGRVVRQPIKRLLS